MRTLSHRLLALPLLAGAASAQDVVRITEWMYKGNHAEFLELTNLGAAPVDMTGWSMDDQSAQPGKVDLSPLGVLAPGESAIVTEGDSVLFAAEWGLSGVKIRGGNLDAPLGRNDQINLYDAASNLHDRLTYGDEDFPGTLRTDGISGNVCDEALGADYVWSWEASAPGDGRGTVLSTSGDFGNPGTYVPLPCDWYRYCAPAQPNSLGLPARIFASGSRAVADNDLALSADRMPLNKFGYFLTSETQGFVSQPPGSEGDLCLAGKIGRYSKSVLNTGSTGEFDLVLDLTQMPLAPPQPVLPGDTWNFTAWYRDNDPGPTSNFTDAVSITFE